MTPAKESRMPAIRIYESALCCDTGVCGPDVDQSLVDVTADVRHLQGLGADIARYNLASEPTAFAEEETVRGFMHLVGSKGLPLIVVDGVTVAAGTYPDRSQLLAFAGLGDAAVAPGSRALLGLHEKSGGCCGGSTGCC
jgi:arsenite-transporting ATPase